MSFSRLLLPILLFLAACGGVVEPQERGIFVFMGTAYPEVLEPGYHFATFSDLITTNVTKRSWKIEDEGLSVDNQEVDFVFTLITQLREDGVYSKITEYPDLYEGILLPAATTEIKNEIAKYTASDVNLNRSDIANRIQATLTPLFAPYHVDLNEVQFTDMGLDDDFMKAVRAKQVAEQDKLRATQELERKTTEAQLAIATAEADATAQRTTAEAEAYAIEQTGQALRRNPEVLKLRQIEKWDGVMPKVTGSDDIMLMIDSN